MSEPVLSMSADPASHTTEEPARAVAAILAAGLLRLIRPNSTPITPPSSTPENLSESLANQLAELGEKSVTVTAG